MKLFERAIPPIDKACGEGLLPDGVAALEKLGVTIPADSCYALQGVRFTDGHSSVTAEFREGRALGVRRTVLHKCLEARASELGVSLHWGVNRIHFSRAEVRLGGDLLQTKLMVGADGQNSDVRRAGGLDKPVYDRQRYGFRRHFAIRPWSRYVELHWGKKSQLYITPISEREIGVALLCGDPRLRLDRALAEFPEIRDRLSSAPQSSREMGSITTSRRIRRVSAAGLALVGDASGSVDAITGEGMCLAFREALALAAAFRAGDLSKYERAHRALLRRPSFMARSLVALGEHGELQRRALSTLSGHPTLFRRLLAFHIAQ